ncbi:MAG: helix-turn-helix domain-containing protein [Proteobacteria bacterium]|nr:helix-turn-helix domain-containing protein [Pseudomonadota bacterium]
MPTDRLAAHNPTAPDSTVAGTTAGEVLRQERLRRGWTEKDVAEQLHITKHYIKALETNSFEKLPGAVFAKGYIKNYAALLKVDQAELLRLYEEFNTRQSAAQAKKNAQTSMHKRDRNKPWVVLSVIGFVGGFTVLWAYNILFSADTGDFPSAVVDTAQYPTDAASVEPSQEPAVSIIEPTAAFDASAIALIEEPTTEPVTTVDFTATRSSIAADTQANDNPSAAAAEPTEALASSIVGAGVAATGGNSRVIEIGTSGNDVLRITFSGESWVEVNDRDATQIYRDIRKAGDVLEITGSAPFSVLLGDAPFTRLSLNGIEIDVSNNIRIDNSARLTVGL